MTLNPLHLLDTLLSDYASPKVRRGLHTLILLVLALVSMWFASGEDWREMLSALAVLIYAGANRANTPPLPEDDEDEWPGTEDNH